MKKEDNKSKKEKHDNPGNNEKEQLRKYENKGKKVMRVDLDDEKRNISKNRTAKEKKTVSQTSMIMKTNSLENMRKMEKKLSVIIFDSEKRNILKKRTAKEKKESI